MGQVPLELRAHRRDAHEAFAQRMADEYAAAREAGELDMQLFDPISRDVLGELLDSGAAKFAADHPETY